MCYNAVDRHVEAGRGDQTAIIHDSPVTQSKQHVSYRELLDQVTSHCSTKSTNIFISLSLYDLCFRIPELKRPKNYCNFKCTLFCSHFHATDIFKHLQHFYRIVSVANIRSNLH